jgi:hypothetical protein
MLKEQEIDSNEHLSASFTLKETKGDLKVVISWLDPLTESTAIYPMFTSLDLSVVDPCGTAHLAGLRRWSSLHQYKQNELQLDAFSTICKVVIPHEELQTRAYTVQVKATTFPTSSNVRFSVAIFGAYVNLYFNNKSGCLPGCEANRGGCSSGKYQCPQGEFRGIFESESFRELPAAPRSLEFTLLPLIQVHFTLDVADPGILILRVIDTTNINRTYGFAFGFRSSTNELTQLCEARWN